LEEEQLNRVVPGRGSNGPSCTWKRSNWTKLYLEEELLVLIHRHDEVERGAVHDEPVALLAALQLLSVPLHLPRHRHADHRKNTRVKVTTSFSDPPKPFNEDLDAAPGFYLNADPDSGFLILLSF